jgi:ankyrin repeat protein
MSASELPERPSLEYLKRRAKERLGQLRQHDPRVQLARAQLEIAREYGFPSWRALKTEIDRRRAPTVVEFFEAAAGGDVATLRRLLSAEPGLARERNSNGSTGLHLAGKHPEAVRVLLEHGADPNARDVGDNATPLFFAAGGGPIETVRLLLDAGADPRAEGDVHQLEAIGSATCFGPTIPWDIVNLLLERGAKHHIFSAIAVQDPDVVEVLVDENPSALARRMSPSENRQSALHYVIAPPDGLLGGGFRTGDHYAMLDLLIELGADLEAEDNRGRTPLAVAMLRGDQEAMRRLKAAGAREPKPSADREYPMSSLASSVKRIAPMISVPDVRATVEWYRSIGFELEGAFEDDGVMNWAGVYFGGAYIMLVPSRESTVRQRDVHFWLHTNRVDDLYQAFKRRQLDHASEELAGQPPSSLPSARFQGDIYNAFYGQREFTIVDPNGYELTFSQSINE